MTSFSSLSIATSASAGPSTLSLVRAPRQLSGGLSKFLFQSGMIETEEQISLRKDGFMSLKSILLGEHVRADRNGNGPVAYSSITREVSLVIVAVGSFGLDVWDVNSDIDCLCVGSSSVNTFFSLARQRLRRAADQGIKILRADKAGSGTMFEIEIRGIKLDLQYFQARVAES